MMTADNVRAQLRELGSQERAKASERFFKTGLGQYGEGDVFLGVPVPEQRKVAKRYKDLPMNEVEALLHSPEHEFRLAALIIWVNQYQKGDLKVKAAIYRRYLANTKWINNWDLVDSSASYIVGAWLANRDRKVLDELAVSENLWERRIAIVATGWYINLGQPEDTLRIAQILMSDKQDLIHKATGWMLREIGKKCSLEVLETWLEARYKVMPRTMLRYAIEHIEPKRRKLYLNGFV